MKDKYIPELIMSVIISKDNDRILNNPILKCVAEDYSSEKLYESSRAIRLSDLREILEDIFGEEEKVTEERIRLAFKHIFDEKDNKNNRE